MVTSKFLLDAPSLKAVTFRNVEDGIAISNNRFLSRLSSELTASTTVVDINIFVNA